MPKSRFFSRKTNNLIASFRGLPHDTSRGFFREEKSLDAVMEQVIQKFQIKETRPEEIIHSEWLSLVGEHNAKHANPWRLDRGNRLYILVNNPVVKQEMLFHKKIILNRLKQLPGCESIRDLIFRSG